MSFVIVIVGPSGSGKSTFLRSLNLLEIPDSGSIMYGGIDIATLKKNQINIEDHSRNFIINYLYVYSIFPINTRQYSYF